MLSLIALARLFSTADAPSPTNERPRILVVFIGGMTYGEASCVRHIGATLRKDIVMLTTDTVTGNDVAAALDGRSLDFLV